MLTSRSKKVRLNTPQSIIELLKECSQPTHYPKHETNIVGIRHTMSKKNCITLIEDYELMKKHLKKCGYKISTLWAIGLDGTITKTERGELEHIELIKNQTKLHKRFKKRKRKKLMKR